ncbi:MAG: hypothetical protein WCX90_03655 [Thiohalomonadaceae bacterium]
MMREQKIVTWSVVRPIEVAVGWLLLLIGCSLNITAQAASGDYLKELQAETEVITRGKTDDPVDVTAPAERVEQQLSRPAIGRDKLDELPGDLTHAQFEEILRDNYLGTYVFYNKLSDTDKARVYEAYGSNPAIVHLRDITTTLLRK